MYLVWGNVNVLYVARESLFFKNTNILAFKNLTNALKRFPSLFYRRGVCIGYSYSIAAIKSGFSRIGGLSTIYLEIREKIKSILKKLHWPGKSSKLVGYSFFSSHLYPKRKENCDQLSKWKNQTSRVFWKKTSIFPQFKKRQ